MAEELARLVGGLDAIRAQITKLETENVTHASLGGDTRHADSYHSHGRRARGPLTVEELQRTPILLPRLLGSSAREKLDPKAPSPDDASR